VKDADFAHRAVIVRHGEGGKDRVLMLPQSLVPALREQLSRARALWSKDQVEGRAGVEMPDALERKYPRAGSSWQWFWVFPQATHAADPRSGVAASCGDTTCSIRRSSVRSSVLWWRRASPSRRRRTAFVTRLPRTCFRPGTTSERCRSCSGMPTWLRR
jgi:integrase